jgi:hypothetical protein
VAAGGATNPCPMLPSLGREDGSDLGSTGGGVLPAAGNHWYLGRVLTALAARHLATAISDRPRWAAGHRGALAFTGPAVVAVAASYRLPTTSR